MSHMSRRRERQAASFTLSFCVCILITVIMGLWVIQMTCFRESFLHSQITKSKYAQNVTDEVKDQFISYGMASGFDAEFFTNIVSAGMVENDIQQNVTALYQDNGNTWTNKNKMNTWFYQELLKQAKVQKCKVTPKIKNNLQYLAETCTEDYMDKVKIPLAASMADIIKNYSKKMPVLLGISGLILIFCIIMLRRIHSFHGIIRNMIYAVSGSILFLTVPFAALKISGKIERIGITNKALYFFIQQYTAELINAFFISAAITFILLLGLVFAYRFTMPPKSEDLNNQ